MALTIVAAACASSSTTAVPLPSVAAFPEFIQPTIPEAFGRYPAAVSSVNRGWRFLEAGDLGAAEREFRAAVRSSMDFYPVEAALGYLDLAHKAPKAALSHFEKALA